MIPKINCKFCNNELTLVFGAPAGTGGSIHTISCIDCISNIPNPLRSEEIDHSKHSKHTVYYSWEDGKARAENLIIDIGISIYTNYGSKKTIFHKYIYGGLMELEEILTIPQKDINPLDPELLQKLKVWLVFS